MTDKPDRSERAEVRPFADILRDLDHGQVADEAAIQLQSLVEAVMTNGKKGTFTLTVEVAPWKGNKTALQVSAKATTKPPAGEAVAAVFFTDDNFNLIREDPNQPQLPLRTTDTNVAPIRS